MNTSFLFLITLITLQFLVHIKCDTYMHNPRGSNNRLNSRNTNTRNNNRLFDSQNNNNGGYLFGPPLSYYEKSLLQIEWTAQHGCGGKNGMHKKVDCNYVIQYMCGEKVRDGYRDEDNPALGNNELIQRKNQNPDELLVPGVQELYRYGQHESHAYFEACEKRERNKGLFTADRNLRNDIGARATRQNPQGTQRGFECPEERDYYPYWHPTPWKDIAVLTSALGRCDFYKSHSQNVRGKNYCSEDEEGEIPSEYNNEKSCLANDYYWQISPSWGLKSPQCKGAAWSRVNHLGNARDHNGYTNQFLWILPSVGGNSEAYENCVMRIRYNISSHDYAPFGHLDGKEFVDSRYNRKATPVTQDPYVFFGQKNLSLAINTNQFGRTFQDRSHTWAIKARSGVGIDSKARIFNLNVRGKRGNIVQAYPNVEYDFVPNILKIKSKDYVHFQWTGSDRNPNNYDGEGRAGTDRSNIVQMANNEQARNYPMAMIEEDRPYEHHVDLQNMFDQETAYKFAHLEQPDFCLTADETQCCLTVEQLEQRHGNNKGAKEQDIQNCAKLNLAEPYFEHPPIQFSKKATYHYMSSRNNNFTNRSQKGTLIINPHLDWQAIVVVSIGAVAFVAAAVVAGGVWYTSSHPGTQLDNIFAKGV